MRNLLLIIVLLLCFVNQALTVDDCTDGNVFDDKCKCTGDETEDGGVMPCLRNYVEPVLHAFGKDHGPYKRHFFIHRNECLGALGVNALPHPKDVENWPEYRRADSNTRIYKSKRWGQVTGECKSGLPSSPLERMMIMRDTGATIDNVKYTVQSNWCWGRRNLYWESDQYENLCSLAFDRAEPDYNWGNSYKATFESHQVGTTSKMGTIKTLSGSSGPGYTVGLRRIYPGENFGSFKNSTNLTKVCGFIMANGSEFPDEDSARFGCVDEPPMPGPDVYNKTLKSKLSPRVDTNICMDASQQGKDCDRGKPTMIDRGSTFDKPMVVLTGSTTNEDNILELRYQFEGDFDPSIKTCAIFEAPGFERIEYCAQLNPMNPGEVCACKRGNANPLPNNSVTNTELYDEINHNYCGDNPIMQCVPRPTLEHSSLKLVPEYVAIPDAKRGRPIPSIKPVFVKTRGQGGEIAYVDKQNRDVCIGGDNKYYICDSSMQPTTALAEAPIGYKSKLALPRDGFSIKEYYLQETMVNNNEVVEDVFKGVNCVDSNNAPVYFDYDLKFYKIINGKLNNNQPAVGDAKCYMPKVGSTPAGIRTILPSDLPTTVLQDSRNYIYGLNLSTMIPEIKADNTIRFERFVGPYDYSLAVKECIPYTFTDLCDAKGTTVFFPAGVRDRTLCGNVPPIDQAACMTYNMGDHDSDALKARCPGVFKDHYGTGVNSICLRVDSDWTYDTIENYNKYLAYRSPVISGSDCREPMSSELCIAIGSTCEAVTSRNYATGFTLWPEMNNNETKTAICDPAKGLVNTLVLSLTLPTKSSYCGKIQTGTACSDTDYVAYIAEDGAWMKLERDIKALQTSFWEQGKNITKEAVQGVVSQYDALTQSLFADFSKYTWEDPKRTCMNRSSTYEYPCKVTDSCYTINQATSLTGYATWLANPDTELALSTSEKQPDAVVDKVVTGKCMTGKIPATNTQGPTRLCRLTLNEKGETAFGFWASAFKDPCVDPPPPPPTGTTGNTGTTNPNIATCPAITTSDPATGFAKWDATSIDVTTGQISSLATGTCISPNVPKTGTTGPTLKCVASVDSSGNASANWLLESLTNSCVGAYVPPIPVNNCGAITTASSTTGYATWPKADISITTNQKTPNGTVYKTVSGKCVAPKIRVSSSTYPTLDCKITLDAQGNVLRGDWVTTQVTHMKTGVVSDKYSVTNECIDPSVGSACVKKTPWECCGGKEMINNGHKNQKGNTFEICQGSGGINNPTGSTNVFSCVIGKAKCDYDKTSDNGYLLYQCGCYW